MKKITYYFLLFFLLFSPCVTHAASGRYIKEYTDLSPKEKRLTNAIYKTMNRDEYVVYIKTKMNRQECNIVFQAIDATWIPFEGGTYQFSFLCIDKNKNVCAIGVYPQRWKKLYQKNKKYQPIINRWTRQCVKRGMTTRQKRDAIGKYLAKKMSYSLKIHSAGKALKKRKGTCSAYAIIYNAMCKRAGIKSVRCCTSRIHKWNTMKIGGKRYYIDVTFYDTGGKNPKYLHMTKLRGKAHRLKKVQIQY